MGREVASCGLVAAGSVCRTADIKGARSKAVGTTFMGTATAWGYTSNPKVWNATAPVCSLDVVAAQEHMRKATGKPYVRRSEVNGRMYSADETALIAVHKMRTQIGSPVEIEASKAWQRSRGLTGLLNEPLL